LKNKYKKVKFLFVLQLIIFILGSALIFSACVSTKNKAQVEIFSVQPSQESEKRPETIAMPTKIATPFPDSTNTLIPVTTPTLQFSIKHVPFEKEKWTKYDMVDGLAPGSVYDMAIEADDTLWFATSAGVTKYDFKSWKTYTDQDGLVETNTRKIVVQGKDDIWTRGTNTHKLSHLINGVWRTFPENNLFVTSIFVDLKSTVWIGFESDSKVDDQVGLLHIVGKEWESLKKIDGLESNNVLEMAADENNELWCITDRGLSHMNGKAWENYSLKEYPPDQARIRGGQISIAPDGSIWLSANRKLFKFSKGSFTEYNMQKFISYFFGITDLLVSRDGTVWFSSMDDGNTHNILLNYDNKELRIFEDLPFQHVFSIKEDAKGNLWLGTGDAVFRYKKE
jgi:ligand-binding sensor domain-containing protein